MRSGIAYDHGWRDRGMTLIEVVGFIVIVSLVTVGLISAFSGSLRSTASPREMNQALQIAQSRMELILGQRKRLGFTAFLSSYDPCQSGSPEGCSLTSGYSVVTALGTAYSSSDANYRTVTVTVLGGTDGGQLAELAALVTSY